MYAWTNAQIDIEHLDKLSKGVKFNDTKENTFYLCGSEVWFKFILQVVSYSEWNPEWKFMVHQKNSMSKSHTSGNTTESSIFNFKIG